MSEFSRGAETGAKFGVNPFASAISRVNELQAEKTKFDQSLAKESMQLKRMLTQLGAKHEFDKEIEAFKGEEKRKAASLKADANTESLDKFMKAIGGGGEGGQEFPPGTSASVPGPGGSKLNIPVNRKFTGEETKSLTTAESLISDLSDIRTLIKDKKGSKVLGSLPFGAFTEQGQDFKLLKDNLGERLLRLRSGAQINESEYARFRKLLPSVFRKDKIDLKQLDKFEQEFSAVKGRILSGAKWDRNKKEFTGGQEQAGGEGNNKVRVVSPDGKIGSIPASQLEEALSQGFRRQ